MAGHGNAKNYGMQRCSQCKKLKIGEIQSFCKNCGHTSGSDRWFSTEYEYSGIKTVE